MEHNSNARAQMNPEITWDDYYECPRINGVLCPEPLNAIYPSTVAAPPPPPFPMNPSAAPPPPFPMNPSAAAPQPPPPTPTPTPQPFLINPSTTASPPPPPPPPQQQQATGDNPEEELGEGSERTPRKRRVLTASRLMESKHFSLTLLKCQQDQQYILGMHEIATGNITYYRLSPYQKLGRRKMEAKEIILGTRTVSPVAEEVCPNTQCKYNLSIKERLEGRWTTEVRERLGTIKIEKFYFHQKVNKTFRSFNDVATFIIYGVIY